MAERLIWTPREFIKSLPAFLLLMLYITTVASEFTSTILLEDFREIPLMVKPTEHRVNTIMTHPDLLAPSANSSLASMVWESGPPSYPSFAEEILEAFHTFRCVRETESPPISRRCSSLGVQSCLHPSPADRKNRIRTGKWIVVAKNRRNSELAQ